MGKQIHIPNNRTFGNLRGFVEMIYFVRENVKPLDTIVELGAFTGVGTKLLADHFPDTTVFAVDMWKDDFDTNDPICQFDMRMARAMYDSSVRFNTNVVTLKMSTQEAAKKMLNTLDFVYIDADHSYEAMRMDLKNWRSKVRNGGIIAGHDYIVNDSGEARYSHVVRALEDEGMKPDRVFSDSSWAIKIR